MQLPHHWARIPPEIVFFPRWVCHRHPCMQISQGSRGSDRLYALSPSAQCTEAANKARRLIFMIRRSFQDLSKSAFIPLYGALVRPHLEYDMSACAPNLVADINHLERIQRLATRLRDDLIAAFKIFTGFFGYWSELGFPPSRSTRPKRAPLQGTRRCEPPPKERVNVSKKRLEKIWTEVFPHLPH